MLARRGVLAGRRALGRADHRRPERAILPAVPAAQHVGHDDLAAVAGLVGDGLGDARIERLTFEGQIQELPLVVIDQIGLGEGDFIDIGEPMLDGRVVPVSVKTLVFYH